MKDTVVCSGNPRLAEIRGRYHPMSEYKRQQKVAMKKVSSNKAGRFHKLAAKIERTLPRGLRETGNMTYSTTCMLLEVMHEDQMA